MSLLDSFILDYEVGHEVTVEIAEGKLGHRKDPLNIATLIDSHPTFLTFHLSIPTVGFHFHL